MRKSNRIVAGYHLLTMISTCEGTLDAAADSVIKEYLSVESLVRLNLDDELEQIINLNEDQYENHVRTKAEEFYEDSDDEEREEFKLFAKDLIRADEEISKIENDYYRLMLKTWREQNEKKS